MYERLPRLVQAALVREQTDVEEALRDPERIVPAKMGRHEAQQRRGGGLLRIIFVEEEGARVIITVNWTTKVGAYWKET
jgi:mRNA-degrading endonuclease RelE of RelBE toxin-antitoxin system